MRAQSGAAGSDKHHPSISSWLQVFISVGVCAGSDPGRRFSGLLEIGSVALASKRARSLLPVESRRIERSSPHPRPHKPAKRLFHVSNPSDRRGEGVRSGICQPGLDPVCHS